jgi:hypothetical protein
VARQHAGKIPIDACAGLIGRDDQAVAVHVTQLVGRRAPARGNLPAG